MRILHSPEDVAPALKAVSDVFDIDKRLPEQVSKLPLGSRPFMAELNLDPRDWHELSQLAVTHNDESFWFVSLDPSEVRAVKCLADESEDAFHSMLTERWIPGYADSFQVVTDVLAVVGESGTWGCWSERDLLAVVASANPSALEAWMQIPSPHGDWTLGERMCTPGEATTDLQFAEWVNRVPSVRQTLIEAYGDNHA